MEIEQVGKLVPHQQILQYQMQRQIVVKTMQQNKNYSIRNRIEIFQFNSKVPRTEITFTKIDANAQRIMKRKEKGIINVG